ncbi:MAG TPA: serine/threonine-protein kinase [Planctomycetota bacterium]|nr:serine/threonine-protein kinase [Planctomycetota bacterium]
MPDFPSASSESGDPLGLDATTRRCPSCGERYAGEGHSGCAAGPTRPASSRSRLDEIPEEAAAHAQDPSRRLHQYILVRQIGKGGMGTVWKAWDLKLTRWVAIKFLTATDEEDVARFQREAKLAARLRHPNIAPIYEVGEAPPTAPGQAPRPYLAMEYIDGQTLAAAPPLPIRETVEIFVKVARGVDAAHRAGVVHRDLKPQNIMLNADGWPYVMDFGLAKALEMESSLSVSGAIMGTPAFMAPEQAQGHLEEIDARSDVYSLGATLYAVLCRKPPFEGRSVMEVLMKVSTESPPPPRSVRPDLPETLEAILRKAMAPKKEDRYPSAGALAEDLQRFLDSRPVEAPAPPPRGVRLGILLAGTAVLLGAAAMVWRLAARPRIREAGRPAVAATSSAPREDPLAAVTRWRKGWLEDRRALVYTAFRPEDAEAASRAAARLRGLRDLPAVETEEVKDWFRGQIEDVRRDVDRWAARPRSEWPDRREEAARAARWCEAVRGAVREVPELAGVASEAEALGARAAAMASYRGTFLLRVYVRGARVEELRRGGKPVSFPGDPEAPYVVELEVDDYEVDLAHASGRETVAVKGAAHGKTYTLVGRPGAVRLVGP